MSVCVLQNLEKDRVLWTDFLASCREINRFSVSKIGPEPAKPTISLALIPLSVYVSLLCNHERQAPIRCFPLSFDNSCIYLLMEKIYFQER